MTVERARLADPNRTPVACGRKFYRGVIRAKRPCAEADAPPEVIREAKMPVDSLQKQVTDR